MSDIQQRINDLEREIRAIDDHEREIRDTLAKLRQPLVDERDALLLQTVQERMSDPVLNVGDKLIVTEAFRVEKYQRGVAWSFTGDEWMVGNEVTVKDLWVSPVGGLRASIETPHRGATSVTIDTAQDMRRAYLKAEEVTDS